MRSSIVGTKRRAASAAAVSFRNATTVSEASWSGASVEAPRMGRSDGFGPGGCAVPPSPGGGSVTTGYEVAHELLERRVGGRWGLARGRVMESQQRVLHSDDDREIAKPADDRKE